MGEISAYPRAAPDYPRAAPDYPWAAPDFTRGQHSNCSLVMLQQTMGNELPCRFWTDTTGSVRFRAVPPQHRSVALGFSGFAISLLSEFLMCSVASFELHICRCVLRWLSSLSIAGTFPSPIVYGNLIDGACLLWNNACGSKGSCVMYDPAELRWR